MSGFMFVDYPDAPYGSNLVNFKGSIVLLPIAAFSNIFHPHPPYQPTSFSDTSTALDFVLRNSWYVARQIYQMASS